MHSNTVQSPPTTASNSHSTGLIYRPVKISSPSDYIQSPVSQKLRKFRTRHGKVKDLNEDLASSKTDF